MALIQESLSVAHKTGAIETRDLERVVVDTTVRPKAIAHPTDARLLLRALADIQGTQENEKFQIFSHQIMDEMPLLPKMRLVHAISEIPRVVREIIDPMAFGHFRCGASSPRARPTALEMNVRHGSPIRGIELPRDQQPRGSSLRQGASQPNLSFVFVPAERWLDYSCRVRSMSCVACRANAS